MGSLGNTSYIFIPFIFRDHTEFNALVEQLNHSSSWSQIHDEIMYMLKYVADKINSKDHKNCQCFHYELNAEARERFGLGCESDWFTTKSHKFRNADTKFRFQILSVQLYCFSTSVCMMAFKLHFEKDDPLWISCAQYYLKKVSRESIRLDSADTNTQNMLQISEALMEEFSDVTAFQFFFYANPSTERANVLTYLEVEAKESYKRELFYLRRCYSEGFLFAENDAIDSEEIYTPSQDTVWGISPEAAVCLVCPDLGRGEFLQGTFYKNFNAQYLFMYVLLLHQKYVLYMFLTKIGIGMYNDLGTLEDYRHQLYEFETDFVFSCITEVPQYQNLYDRLVHAFALKKMYEDVHEPLLSLSDVRRAAAEDEQKARDTKVNHSLLILSLLSFFSALMDGFGFTEAFFSWFLGEKLVKIVQGSCVLFIFVIGAIAFTNLLKINKRKK